MHREGGVYRFTELGETVWRVEQFIERHYVRGMHSASSAAEKSAEEGP
jgi:hypothetical protein